MLLEAYSLNIKLKSGLAIVRDGAKNIENILTLFTLPRLLVKDVGTVTFTFVCLTHVP